MLFCLFLSTGNMIGQLKFIRFPESSRLIRDFEAVWLRKAHVDSFYVMCKETKNEGQYVTQRWQKFELISNRSGIANLKSILTYWWTQDRRGHLKALKFGQCCSQISEFYSSFPQLCVCRHRDYRGLYFAA